MRPTTPATWAAIPLLAAAPLYAQQRDTTGRVGRLEPIEVTARADSSVRVLPLARLGARELRGARPAVGLEDALARVPGVVAQARGTHALDTRIAIRGFGARSTFGVRGVTVLLDGVPQTLPDGQSQLSHVDPSQLDLVEVMRGVAGAFYGNAAGGVVAMRSSTPFVDGASVRGRVVAGGYGLFSWSAGARAPIGATGASFEASRLVLDGYRVHSGTDLRQASVALARPLGPEWLVQGRVRMSHLARADNPGALDSAQLALDPRQGVARNVAFRAGKEVRQWQGSLEVRRAGIRTDAAAILYGVDRDLDNALPTAWVILDRSGAGARVMVRHAMGPGAELLAGVDVQRQRDARLNFDNDSGRVGSVARLDQVETVTALGARTAVRLLPDARTEVAAGVRADRVLFDVADGLLADGDASGSRTMQAVSFTAALARRIGPLTVHGGAGTSFDTPTTTELARPGTGGLDPSLGPQHTLQWEFGLAMAGRRARMAVTGYTATVRDALVPFEEPAMPGRFFYLNAARTRHRGLEVEASARPDRRIGVTMAWTRNLHAFVRYPTSRGSLDGKQMPGSPRSWLHGQLSVEPVSSLSAEVEVVRAGRTWADDANTAAAPAAVTVDVRAGLSAGGRARAFIGVRNALDRSNVGSVNVNGAARRFYEPAPRRTFYAGMEMTAGR